jgi:excisionase family DNA binding protein
MKRQPRLNLEPLLLRGGEVAEVLGCSRALAYRWMAAGVIPTVRVPGSRSIRVPREALMKWISEHTDAPRGGAVA